MGSFHADMDKLEALYLENADAIFLMAYIHTSLTQNTTAVIQDTMQNIAAHEKSYTLAMSGRQGLLYLLHDSCMEYQRKKPRKKVKADMLKKTSVPFEMSDLLIAILHLPYECKSSLVLCQGLGYSPAAAAGILRKSESSVSRHLAAAAARLETAGSWNSVRQTLQSVRASLQTHQRIIDKVVVTVNEKGFEGKQRLKRFKRGMDDAIPYMALCILALCLFSFLAVHFGWFSREPYAGSVPLGQPSGAQSAFAVSEDRPLRSLAVYAPEADGLVEYIVSDAPDSIQKLIPLMVSLGALPEGTALLYADYGPAGGIGSAPADAGLPQHCQLQLSAEAAAYMDDPVQGRLYLQGLVETLRAFYGPIDDIQVLSGGGDLLGDGLTAQQLLDAETNIIRTSEIQYRE